MKSGFGEDRKGFWKKLAFGICCQSVPPVFMLSTSTKLRGKMTKTHSNINIFFHKSNKSAMDKHLQCKGSLYSALLINTPELQNLARNILWTHRTACL